MKRLKPVLLFVLFTGLSAFASDNIPTLFANRMDRAKMSFTQPDNYTSVPVIVNGQMSYLYALKYPDRKFEIRYSVTPLDSLFIQYEAMKKAGSVITTGPNQLYSGAFMATVMNLSGGVMPSIREFPKQAVLNEFNADWGATCIFHVTGAFGEGYNTCMAVAIHKDNLGDAYIFYLSDNGQNYQDLLEPAFHALKFK